MELKVKQLESLLQKTTVFFENTKREILEEKISAEKWSKKEILGHLIDSAINNIQRFTEIQYNEKPYKIRQYNPDELVKANNYQEKDIDELFQLWLQLNKQIVFIIKNQTPVTLEYPILLPDNEVKNLQFLMTDYVDHLEHHLNQILL